MQEYLQRTRILAGSTLLISTKAAVSVAYDAALDVCSVKDDEDVGAFPSMGGIISLEM